jgi:hypothetical protein
MTLYDKIYKECEAEHLDQDAIKAICDEHDDYMDKQANLLKRADEIIANATEEINGLEQRLTDVTRNNLIMAEQLKKREGFWIAPMEADEEMFIAGDQYTSGISDLNKAYEAMRENWLRRQK